MQFIEGELIKQITTTITYPQKQRLKKPVLILDLMKRQFNLHWNDSSFNPKFLLLDLGAILSSEDEKDTVELENDNALVISHGGMKFTGKVGEENEKKLKAYFYQAAQCVEG